MGGGVESSLIQASRACVSNGLQKIAAQKEN